MGGQLSGKAPHQRFHRRFAGIVGGDLRPGHVLHPTGGEEEEAGPARGHPAFGCGLGCGKSRAHVQIHQAVEFVQGVLLHGVRAHHSRVAADNIGQADCLLHPRKEPLDFGGIGGVGLEIADLGRMGQKRLRIAGSDNVIDNDRRAVLGQHIHHHSANRARAAGDEDGFVGEVEKIGHR